MKNGFFLPLKGWITTPIRAVFYICVVVKNSTGFRRGIREVVLFPGSGRFPGEGHGNPLQYPCLENLMDRGACQAVVHSVAELDTAEATEHCAAHIYLKREEFQDLQAKATHKIYKYSA